MCSSLFRLTVSDLADRLTAMWLRAHHLQSCRKYARSCESDRQQGKRRPRRWTDHKLRERPVHEKWRQSGGRQTVAGLCFVTQMVAKYRLNAMEIMSVSSAYMRAIYYRP